MPRIVQNRHRATECEIPLFKQHTQPGDLTREGDDHAAGRGRVLRFGSPETVTVTVPNEALVGSTVDLDAIPTFEVTPAVEFFEVTGPASAVAGDTEEIAVTAYWSAGNVVLNYDGAGYGPLAEPSRRMLRPTTKAQR